MSEAIAIGCDEAGLELKARLVEELERAERKVVDYGCTADYPEVAFELARRVARGEHDRGILICGTGIGMAIAANKVPGVYAAQAHDSYSAERARKSNDAQILALGALVVGPALAVSLLHTWLRPSSRAAGRRARSRRSPRPSAGRAMRKLINDPFEAVDEMVEASVSPIGDVIGCPGRARARLHAARPRTAGRGRHRRRIGPRARLLRLCRAGPGRRGRGRQCLRLALGRAGARGRRAARGRRTACCSCTATTTATS